MWNIVNGPFSDLVLKQTCTALSANQMNSKPSAFCGQPASAMNNLLNHTMEGFECLTSYARSAAVASGVCGVASIDCRRHATVRRHSAGAARATPAGKEQAVFTGIQIYQVVQEQGASRVRPQSADVVEQQLKIVQAQGYHGYAFFAYNSQSDELLELVRIANGNPAAQ